MDSQAPVGDLSGQWSVQVPAGDGSGRLDLDRGPWGHVIRVDSDQGLPGIRCPPVPWIPADPPQS